MILRQLVTTSFPVLFFSDERLILINNIRNIDNNNLNLNDSRFSEALLFVKPFFEKKTTTKNKSILNTTIKYIV